MKYSNAAFLCEELYKHLSDKHGFTSIGNCYGFEDGLAYVEYKTVSIDTGNGLLDGSADPRDLETLGEVCNKIAAKFGYELYKLQGRSHGYGDLYFKPLYVKEKHSL
jgi:hypothetical protein